MKRIETTLTTAASGAVTAYVEDPLGILRGKVAAIRYVKVDFASTVDIIITGEISGIEIYTWTNVAASETVYPFDTGTYLGIPIADERIKIAIAQGGFEKSGKFHFWIGEAN